MREIVFSFACVGVVVRFTGLKEREKKEWGMIEQANGEQNLVQRTV